MATAALHPRPMLFALDGREVVLELPRAVALDLLEWLGLGRPDFGAIEISVLLPLCRRRLWLEPRNDGPMRSLVARLAKALAEQADRDRDACVHFG